MKKDRIDVGRVPNLRFPQFEGQWEMSKLGEVMEFKVTNSFSRENLNYDVGTVKNIHYGDIHKKFQTLFDITKEEVPYVNTEISLGKISEDFYCKEGDVIFADASEDLNDIGKSIEILNLNNEKVLSGLHTLLGRPNVNYFHKGFNGYLFTSNSVRYQIQKESQGTKVLSINVGRISGIRLSFPSLSEQEKIASFLSLIDERILAQSKIIEGLKELKVSLSKQIFSRKLRFKDENGDDFPEWEEKQLGEIGEIITGKTPSTGNLNLWNGDIQFVTPTDIDGNKYQYKTERKVYNTGKLKILPAKSILFTCIASIGKMSLSIKPCITNQQINSIVPFPEFDNDYIYYALLNIVEFIKSTQSSNTLPIINKTSFSKFDLKIPKNVYEQQKIASILSVIDEKIEIEKRILEEYTAQKQYLLKQMFI